MNVDSLGTTSSGQSVEAWTLRNSQGMQARILTLGGILSHLILSDGTDVVLGFDELDEYLVGHPCLGTICGRFANRIAKGRFQLDGQAYTLATNQGPNHLHGGRKGFDKVIWKAEPLSHPKGEALRLRYISPDGEEGYPGKLTVSVDYILSADNALHILYAAQTDAPTVLNLTHHGYFNLAGKGSILDHELRIYAEHFLPSDIYSIPTGELRLVASTPFDFRSAIPIGHRIEANHDQLRFGNGYDHCFVLAPGEAQLRLAARVYEPTSQRQMEVLTTEPGLQLYTANHLDGRIGKQGIAYKARHAFCLEAQHFPDSPNQPHFPNTVLRPGEKYEQETVYRFG